MLGMAKLPLPEYDDTEALFRRCERDVEVLTKAMLLYIGWLKTGECGNWQMTGASQAWSHWRHSHYTHKILVHNNSDALAAERAAMHTGRCEAWKWGKYSGDTWFDYDWHNSYPRIARDTDLPTRLVGMVRSVSSSSLLALMEKYAVLAEVDVDTQLPCVPASHDDRTLWPVGTFCTTLWSPELALLLGSGADVRVRRAWLYKREPALRSWANWMLSSLHDKTDTVEPWKKLILKHWSRALIGRFGMRYSSWQPFAEAEDERIYISDWHNSEDGTSGEIMQVGRQVFTSGELAEIRDGCPQITSYIMSEARAKLWRVMQHIGQDSVWYTDTDSLIVNGDGHNAIMAADGRGDFDGLRLKHNYHRIVLYGPRSIICDKRPTVAGMPKRSRHNGNGKWTGEVWRGARESVRLEEHDKVRIQETAFQLRYNPRRRYFNSDGSTISYLLPDYTPAVKPIVRPNRWEEARQNGYPAMLASAQATKRMHRSERSKAKH